MTVLSADLNVNELKTACSFLYTWLKRATWCAIYRRGVIFYWTCLNLIDNANIVSCKSCLPPPPQPLSPHTPTHTHTPPPPPPHTTTTTHNQYHCTPAVLWLYPTVPWLYPYWYPLYPCCTLTVPLLYPDCTPTVPWLYPYWYPLYPCCTLTVPLLYPDCTPAVPWLYPECTPAVPLNITAHGPYGPSLF